MRKLAIREVRAVLSHLDELLEREGELIITRHGKPVARILPVRPRRRMPSRAALRASMPRLSTPSEALVREDRDAR